MRRAHANLTLNLLEALAERTRVKGSYYTESWKIGRGKAIACTVGPFHFKTRWTYGGKVITRTALLRMLEEG